MLDGHEPTARQRALQLPTAPKRIASMKVHEMWALYSESNSSQESSPCKRAKLDKTAIEPHLSSQSDDSVLSIPASVSASRLSSSAKKRGYNGISNSQPEDDEESSEYDSEEERDKVCADILECFRSRKEPLTVSQLSYALQYHKSYIGECMRLLAPQIACRDLSKTMQVYYMPQPKKQLPLIDFEEPLKTEVQILDVRQEIATVSTLPTNREAKEQLRNCEE